MLTDGSIFDSAKPLHLHVYLLLLKELPVEENLLTVDEVLKLLTPLSGSSFSFFTFTAMYALCTVEIKMFAK